MPKWRLTAPGGVYVEFRRAPARPSHSQHSLQGSARTAASRLYVYGAAGHERRLLLSWARMHPDDAAALRALLAAYPGRELTLTDGAGTQSTVQAAPEPIEEIAIAPDSCVVTLTLIEVAA